MTHASIQLRMTVYASLMAALVAAGAFLAIPIGPVPIVLQNMFVLLTGLLLGGRWGLASIAVYILAGVLGLPVFAAGRGGIGAVMGPTGGYLLSYLPTVFVVGWLSEKWGGLAAKPTLGWLSGAGARFGWDIAVLVLGTAMVFAGGVPWLKMVTGMSWGKAFAVGVYPFLVGDAIKIVAAAIIARTLRPVIQGRQPSLVQ